MNGVRDRKIEEGIMAEGTDDLKGWITEYLKHKDIFLKSIISMKEGPYDVTVEYRNRKQIALVEPIITNFDSTIEKLKGYTAGVDSVILVVFNTKSNLIKTAESWVKLSGIEKLSIFFVNPYTEGEKRWIISPFTHSKIADKSSIKAGLLSLFSGIEEVRQEKHTPK